MFETSSGEFINPAHITHIDYEDQSGRSAWHAHFVGGSFVQIPSEDVEALVFEVDEHNERMYVSSIDHLETGS